MCSINELPDAFCQGTCFADRDLLYSLEDCDGKCMFLKVIL